MYLDKEIVIKEIDKHLDSAPMRLSVSKALSDLREFIVEGKANAIVSATDYIRKDVREKLTLIGILSEDAIKILEK